MRGRLIPWALRQTLLVAGLCLGGSLATAQQPCLPPSYSPNCLPPPGVGIIPPPTGTAPTPGTTPRTTPGTTTTPGTGTGTTPEMGPGAAGEAAAAANTGNTAGTGASSFGSLASGAGVGSSAGMAAPGGYLDVPIPINMVRVRYDSMYDFNRPDRAEFFYAEWKELSFHPHGIKNGGAFFDPKARGPEQLPGNLDAQQVSNYIEMAYNNRFSAFVEVPFRWNHFGNLQEDPDNERMPNGQFFSEPNQGQFEPRDTSSGGIGDITAGFKAAIIADPRRYVTFQFTTFLPTGDPSQGMGTGHASLEPGLLFYERLTDRLILQGQFEDWIPIGGGTNAFTGQHFAGNILIYGVGAGYAAYKTQSYTIMPVTELLGWTCLNGLQSQTGPINATPPPGLFLPVSHGVANAAGDTIVNAKLGVRTFFGRGSSVYFGYGHALTGDHWYKNDVRVEYRYTF